MPRTARSTAKTPPASVHLRIDFDATQSFGPGKAHLLELIEKTGSISAAGRALKMSYRRAWLLVDELNRMFAAPLVDARHGGGGGGGAGLTPTGAKVLALYRRVERGARSGALAELRTLAQLVRR